MMHKEAYYRKEEFGNVYFLSAEANYVNDITEGVDKDNAIVVYSGKEGVEEDEIYTALDMSVEDARAFAMEILEICDAIECKPSDGPNPYGFPISRSDEAAFPSFTNVDVARKYFMKRYGDRYNIGDSEMIGGTRWYFDDVDGQPVQIDEHGFVHVVY